MTANNLVGQITMDVASPVGQSLLDAYAAQCDRYQEAERVLANLTLALERGSAETAEGEALQAIILEIAATDSRIAETKRRLPHGQQPAHDVLVPMLERIAETLCRLQKQIQKIETETTARLGLVAVLLDKSCRGSEMVRAYSSHSAEPGMRDSLSHSSPTRKRG